METPVDILKKYWGYDTFRPLQEEVIHSIIAGHDTLALMPTGGGKSLCYQVPGMMRDGLCLVITPLIALMKDQVANLKKKKIPALSIYSGMSYAEVIKALKNAAHGNFKFLYVSPERLETTLFLEYVASININLLAVDEAHCISQWGYDFRPPYLRISSIREKLNNVPVVALTASATLEVQDDICNKLAFKNANRFQQSFERNNLSYSVFNLASKQNKLITILQKVGGSSIVYCKSRKRTKEIEELLNFKGIKTAHYHAGLSNDVRSARQEDWITNTVRVIASTNAFGMGIDKPDVRTVIHYDVPDSLENYYQEAGRAGRDQKKAYAILLFNEQEIIELKKQSLIRFPGIEVIKNIYAALANYLQLPSGSGEGLSFDFDLGDFAKKFKQDVLVVNNVLKILEQEEIINYSEQFFSPSTVVFTTHKEEIELFENTHPHLTPAIKGLLRSYEGIFDYPAVINESRLAKFISFKRNDVIAQLKELNVLKIIEYVPQKENPQIQFLINRLNVNDFVINQKNLNKRRQAFEKRLSAMISFIKNEHLCRSKLIGEYFNDKNIKACGICDNCLREKQLTITKEEFEDINGEIQAALSEKPKSLQELISLTGKFKEDKIRKVLKFLQEENCISVTGNGLIILRSGKDTFKAIQKFTS